MPRTVQAIEEADKAKANLGVDDELESIDVDDLAAEKPPVDKGPTPEEVAADLKKQLEDKDRELAQERVRANEADARANAAGAATNTARQNQIATQEQAVLSRAAAAKTTLESVKQQLKQAKAAGDGDAEVDLQDAMAEARYELNAAEWEKNQFAKWKEQQEKAPPQTAETPSRYTAAEQKWLDAHPEFHTDKKFARMTKILAAEALDEGHKQDSKAFFTYVENGLRENGFLNESDPTSGAGDDVKTKTSTSTGAPPMRSGNVTPTVAKPNPKYPFLTKGFVIPKEWVEAAKDQGFDDVLEYANSRLEIEEQDKSRR